VHRVATAHGHAALPTPTPPLHAQGIVSLGVFSKTTLQHPRVGHPIFYYVVVYMDVATAGALAFLCCAPASWRKSPRFHRLRCVARRWTLALAWLMAMHIALIFVMLHSTGARHHGAGFGQPPMDFISVPGRVSRQPPPPPGRRKSGGAAAAAAAAAKIQSS